jgi:hypothetical protein
MKYQDLSKYFYLKFFWEVIEHVNIEQNVELFFKFSKKMCFFHAKVCGYWHMCHMLSKLCGFIYYNEICAIT